MSEISVLVPSYNHAPFVERTLRSIFQQTLRPKKLIVIDDGSKDESVEIIERVLKDCPFEHRLIARENKGLCETLNEGFALCGGEYFAYLGSDDLWLPEFLAESTELLERRPAAVLAFGHSYWIDETENIIGKTSDWTDFADGDMQPLLLRGEIFSSPSVVYRHLALEKHRWNESAILEDYEMYLKLSHDGEFARSDRILNAWRIHSTNTSGDYEKLFPELIAAQDRLADRLYFSDEELAQVQAELKFKAAAEFIRKGNRREAFSLLRNNLNGAQSSVEIAKMLFRLSIPQTLFQWNRMRKRRQNIKEYGKLDLDSKS